MGLKVIAKLTLHTTTEGDQPVAMHTDRVKIQFYRFTMVTGYVQFQGYRKMLATPVYVMILDTCKKNHDIVTATRTCSVCRIPT